MKVKKILECICVNCGRLKADIVSRVPLFVYSFAPLYPTFWGLSPNPWRTPSPLCVRSRQSRRSSTRDADPARFRSLDRRGVHCITSGVGWTRGCVVKWGAERGVRKKNSAVWSSHAGMQRSNCPGCHAALVACFRPALTTRCLLPPVIILFFDVLCVVEAVSSPLVAHANVLSFMLASPRLFNLV